MSIIHRLFKPKEVRAAIALLDKLSFTYNSTAFYIVKNDIKKMILAHPTDFVRIIQKGKSLDEWIYAAIANIAGDYAECGEYHIYRGILSPLGMDMLRLYTSAVDELVRIGAMSSTKAEEQKIAISKNIEQVG